MEPSFTDAAVRRPEAQRIMGLVRADLCRSCWNQEA